MSTRATIAHGDHFHLYHEVFDEDRVYLKLDGIAFVATPHAVTVAIPRAVWACIRRSGEPDLSAADETDEALSARVRSEVAARLGKVREWREHGRGSRFEESFGWGAYGSPDEPEEEQVRRGIGEMTVRRERARKLAADIRAIEEGGRP
jgi:hypothetical protein